MKDIVSDFLEYLTRTKNYSAHTVTAYETDIQDFLSFYERFNGGTVSSSDLSRADTLCFRSYLADRQRRGLAHKSTARALSSLRSFYRYLSHHCDISNDYISLISSPKVPRKLSKAIEPVDVEHMHGAIREIDSGEPWLAARDWALVLLLFGCGLRISEAVSLKNCDTFGRADV